jgi:hypothetical protein
VDALLTGMPRMQLKSSSKKKEPVDVASMIVNRPHCKIFPMVPAFKLPFPMFTLKMILLSCWWIVKASFLFLC